MECSIPIPVDIIYICTSHNKFRTHLEVLLEEVMHQNSQTVEILLVQVFRPQSEVIYNVVEAFGTITFLEIIRLHQGCQVCTCEH